MDPAQRASFLEEDEEMEKAHSVAVSAGDTEAKDGVIEHYVCFSCVDDEIFELDGGNSQPISHGPSSPDSLLQVKSLISVVYFHQLFPFLYMFLQIYVLYT
jgi:ubiquitin carboxyl-terminal hydrolase L3